jgi:hypothetical protein
MEFTGKRALSGLKLAFGPGALVGRQPGVLAKYRKQLGASR